MIMPAGIGREELQTLTGQGAQPAGVLPAEDYAWARLHPVKAMARPVQGGRPE
jgi:hypothetical protein